MSDILIKGALLIALLYAVITVILIFTEVMNRKIVPQSLKSKWILIGLSPLFLAVVLSLADLALNAIYLGIGAIRPTGIDSYFNNSYDLLTNFGGTVLMALVYFGVLTLSVNRGLFAASAKPRFHFSSAGECIDALKAAEDYVARTDAEKEAQRYEEECEQRAEEQRRREQEDDDAERFAHPDMYI